MHVRDVMTATVVTITPDTSVRDIVAILLERRISGLPVVADGAVVGMVGEGELLHRYESAPTAKCLERRGGTAWWAATRGRPAMSSLMVSGRATS